MDAKEIYKVWAPENAKWANWVRPVPFVSIDKIIELNIFNIPQNIYLDYENKNTAIIVDLPGSESIEFGIALAQNNFRPIPIYNGTSPQKNILSTTDNEAIKAGLVWGAKKLTGLNLKQDASPVFLLDRNRMNRYKMNFSVFDNSWDIYGQDMPSAKYVKNNGINQVVVIADSIQKDLRKILYKYQKQGIKIIFSNGYDRPRKIKIRLSILDILNKEIEDE